MSVTNISKYDNYFHNNDYFIYCSNSRTYMLKVISVNPYAEDMAIYDTHKFDIFHSDIFFKYSADIPSLYKVKQVHI